MSGRGLVLGSGGVLGLHWMVAALTTWAEHTGVDPTRFDQLVGTSAGSVIAAGLASGQQPAAMLRHLRGEPAEDDPILEYDHDRLPSRIEPAGPAGSSSRGIGSPGLAGWFRRGIGSPELAGRVLRQPRRFPPVVAASAFIPSGRRSLEELRLAVDRLSGGAPWPRRPRTWIMAMDFDLGRRVAFGAPGAPRTTLADAVIASCAVPWLFAPVPIAGRRYVDGGICSTASADLLAGEGLDEVTVLAPLALEGRHPAGWHPLVRANRWLRARTTDRLYREIAKLRAAGTSVRVLTPDAAVLTEMGWNVMDPRRRHRVLDAALRTTAAAWDGRRGVVA
jgi:NTE family protein